jgi:uncharacterized protein (DUF2235 family)
MKRIITCSDGTWNKPGTIDQGIEVKTNVEKMYLNICATGAYNIKQVKAYDQGVGSGYSPLDKIKGGATGEGIDKNIKDMYAFICINYHIGDEIYLFGFSRGAYTARSLAGFIRNCGILKPEHISLVDTAYNLYRDRNSYSEPDSDLMQSWRVQYCFEDVTPIQFIGVWDTVGSLGVPLKVFKDFNVKKYQFHDCTLSSFVKNAYHALAIDERRKLFTPTLWTLSKSVVANPDHPQKMEQRWFSGVHSNIGGGYSDAGLSDLTLDWISKKAADVGLCFSDPLTSKIEPNYKGKIIDSYTWLYWLTRAKLREIDLNNLIQNQHIDESVWERYTENPSIMPENLKPFSKIP